jgi:hypothetical protein
MMPFDSAYKAAITGDSTTIALLVSEREIAIRAEKLTVIVVNKGQDDAEVIIPSIGGIDHLYVKSSDLELIR